jgi:putative adhesin
VSIAEGAPPEAQGFPAAQRPRAWRWLVAASALTLLLVAGVLTAWWAATRETRTSTYDVLGDLGGITLDLQDADVQIDGGSAAVEVRKVDRFAFGRPSTERRSVRDGVLTLVSRCPDQVLGGCRTSYRLTVPDNVPVTIRTSSGAVRLTGVRASVKVNTGSGSISATRFCGHSLAAVSDSGAVGAAAECSVEQMTLRSRSGDVTAIVPAGRYRVDAESDSGTSRVRGVTDADDALFQVQALSTSGNVSVEGAAS